jgi:hypothetical protein
MKRLSLVVVVAALLIGPGAALSQSAMMSSSMMGSGAHGYDFLVGTWTCKNKLPASPMAGPPTTTLSVSHTGAGSALFARSTGANFESSGYISYDAKTKRWLGPTSVANGGYGIETSTQTGKKVVWAGTFTDGASGKSSQVRDTYTMTGSSSFTDLGQHMEGGAWKTHFDGTCTKS